MLDPSTSEAALTGRLRADDLILDPYQSQNEKPDIEIWQAAFEYCRTQIGRESGWYSLVILEERLRRRCTYLDEEIRTLPRDLPRSSMEENEVREMLDQIRELKRTVDQLESDPGVTDLDLMENEEFRTYESLLADLEVERFATARKRLRKSLRLARINLSAVSYFLSRHELLLEAPDLTRGEQEEIATILNTHSRPRNPNVIALAYYLIHDRNLRTKGRFADDLSKEAELMQDENGDVSFQVDGRKLKVRLTSNFLRSVKSKVKSFVSKRSSSHQENYAELVKAIEQTYQLYLRKGLFEDTPHERSYVHHKAD